MTANIQISGKAANGIIFVVGGDNYDDFYANLVSVLQSQQDADATVNSARRLISTTGAVPPPAPPVLTGAPQTVEEAQHMLQNAFPQAEPVEPAQRKPTAPPGKQPPLCEHGYAREFRSGVKNNKPWSGWFCPLPRSEGCATSWIR